MIRLEHAKKTYPGFQLDCSMEIREGQITALIGANVPRYILKARSTT